MNNLKQEYIENVIPKLKNEFNYQNIHQVPKVVKITINAGLGLNAQNRAFLQKATEEIRLKTLKTGTLEKGIKENNDILDDDLTIIGIGN